MLDMKTPCVGWSEGRRKKFPGGADPWGSITVPGGRAGKGLPEGLQEPRWGGRKSAASWAESALGGGRPLGQVITGPETRD